jgi:acyl dehydratase
MAIDPQQVLAADPVVVPTAWTEDQVILYHLGLGAGDAPTDDEKLRYVYEADLKVLPSFSVITAQPAAGPLLALPGMAFDPAMMLHGGQELEVHRPLPASTATATSTGRISGLYDKGKAAVAVMEVVLADEDGPLCTNRFISFLRGAGGFGGDPGPSSSSSTPKREPDVVIERRTLPQQAALYRMSGDRNPLHIEPAFATRAGFDQPITHGLATYGITCMSVVDEMLGGDTTRVAGWSARFSGVSFPGETLRIAIWDDGARLAVEVTSMDREQSVLTNGVLDVHV